MSNNTKRKALIAVLCCFIIVVLGFLIMAFILDNCMLEREYYDDIHIQLETHQAEIIIKEWSFLFGSGAEVYYKNDDKEILLGKFLGGDDGFCPFKKGLYSVEVDDNKLIIKWGRYLNDNETNWNKEIFDLPVD